MRRLWLTLLPFLLLAALGVSSSHVRADAIATVSPGGGDMHTAFTFTATGITPGHGIFIAIYDAVGNRYTYQQDGVDLAIVVDDSGAAAIQLTPATDMPGAAPGAWTAVFIEQESGYTATVPFDVAQ